jgi:trans-2-enoyl-CoA reductase
MNLPRKTKALVIESGTAPRRIVQWREIDLPSLGAEEVLVRVLAAPIHPADLNAIEGKYPGTPSESFIGGREGVGIVEASETPSLCRGDTVLLPTTGGTWREFAVYRGSDLIRVPPGIAPLQAALLRINPGTALRLLRDFVSLDPGEWIAQNAASSAVGCAVVQLAKHFGWRTINFTRDPDALPESIRKRGDVYLRDDEAADFRAAGEIRLALNAVGGESALRLANALADGATLATYGAMARQPLRIPNGLLIFRDISFRGFWLTRWSQKASPTEQRAMIDELIQLAVDGVIHSFVDSVHPLENFAEAFARAAQGGRRGKVLFGAPEILSVRC